MDAYMWHQQKQHPDAVHNGASANPATRNGAQNVNTQQWDGYGYGSAPTTTNAQQSYYDPGWMYEDFSGQMQQNISPAAILAQRAPNGSSHGPGAVMDGPTTIDPTLMMTSPYPHYISPQATQQAPHYPSHPRNTSYQQQQQQPSSYLPMPAADSALSAVIDYEPPQTSISPIDPSTNGLPHAGDTGTGTGGGTRVAPTEQPAALIDQVKKLLTPKQLDRDPQTSAQKLIDLLLPPSSSNTPTHADKDARLEILTRLRDHAPREVFVVLARNLPVLGLLREWGKNACKKEEFGETLMGWLQVVDKLPLTVETLAQSGLGKLIKYVVEHPPTTAIRDMATKIESGWKKVISSQAQDSKADADARPKKRKLEATTIPLKNTTTTPTASSTPASKKAAVMTPAGTRVAVRKDSINSPTTSTFAGSSGAASASASAASTKGAQSDSGFFSKPKQKLPSFRKKPGTGAAATTSTSTSSPAGATGASSSTSGASAADGPPVAYSNPFEDAMKSLRKSNDSPANNAPNPVSSGNTIVGSTPTGTPGISSKTGKPKKKLRWDDAQLEKIKYIERAIYDDDIPGSSGFHGQSYRDLDRAEGNLLKHMVAQIEWFEPPLVNLSSVPGVTPRGESSKEANIQAEREMSALAAFYQGQPPDTPVEPPQLAALPPTADDAGVTTMLLGTQIDEMIQGGGVRPDTLMTAGHWLGQLGMEGIAGVDYNAGAAYGQGMFPPQPQPPAPAPGQEGITDILNKLMKVVNQPEPGAPASAPAQPPPQGTFGASPYGNGAPPAGGYAQNPPPPAGIPNVDNAALMNALAALGVIPGSAPQQPPQNDGSSYGGGAYGGPGAAGGQPYGGGSAAMTSGLPPPLGMPSRDEQEDRWKRSAIKGDALNAAGKRGKRKDVPASQNTWKPLCTFFARGKCRFGEECDFSHDPSKLPK